MSADTFCFPLHEGLPDLATDGTVRRWGVPPTIDGYVEPDLGVTPTPPEVEETGWTRSGRLTYVADAGEPQVNFQGLKHRADPFIYLSFVVRSDTMLDPNHRIILVFRKTYPLPGPMDPPAEYRRIDIRPHPVQANRDPQIVEYYKFNNTTSAWDPNPITNVANMINQIKVGVGTNGNWSVEIRLPTTTGANSGGTDWIDLDTVNGFGFYFNLIRFCTGTSCVWDLDDIGTGGNCMQYTWPRADYGSKIGFHIDPNPALSYQNPLIVDPPGVPIPPTIQNHLTTATNVPDEANWPDWLGKGILGTDPSCRGVRFENGPNSIGVVVKTNSTPPILADPLGSTVDVRPVTPLPINNFVARVVNDGPTDADGVQATFRIAKWGIGPSVFTTWPKVPTSNATSPNDQNPTASMIITAPIIPALIGPTQQFVMQWGASAADRVSPGLASSGSGNDRCLWVQLDSGSVSGTLAGTSTGVNFTESSVRRNMNFIYVSVQDKEAEISGRWEPKPEGDRHQFVLVVSQRVLDVAVLARLGGQASPSSKAASQLSKDGEPYSQERVAERRLSGLEQELLRWVGEIKGQRPRSIWVVINHAFRRTSYTLTVDKVRHRIYEPAGSFGYYAQHIGPVREREYKIYTARGGPKLTMLSKDGIYSVHVPYQGAVTIRTRLETVGPGWRWWLWFLVNLIRRVVDALLGKGGS